MLANVASNGLAVLGVRAGQDILDKIIAKLITSNVYEGHARPIGSSLADTLQVAIEKLATSDFEALLNNLGRVLVHAVFGGEAEDVVNSTTTISRSTMLANVLDTPVTELTMCDYINAGEDLVDTWTLQLSVWYLSWM